MRQYAFATDARCDVYDEPSFLHKSPLHASLCIRMMHTSRQDMLDLGIRYASIYACAVLLHKRMRHTKHKVMDGALLSGKLDFDHHLERHTMPAVCSNVCSKILFMHALELNGIHPACLTRDTRFMHQMKHKPRISSQAYASDEA